MCAVIIPIDEDINDEIDKYFDNREIKKVNLHNGSAMNYQYKAVVTDVYDGDTITVDIDLGFGITLNKQKIRLYGINAPEVRGEEREAGLASRDWLRDKILGKKIILVSKKDKKGKYGRWLGDIYMDGIYINDALVLAGHAKYKDY